MAPNSAPIVEAFITLEAVEACIDGGIIERAPQRDISYLGFVDPSGGSADAMTLAIGHIDYRSDIVMLDALREVRPPFSPEVVTEQFCEVLRSYHISTVRGDRYAAQWCHEQFAKFHITYDPEVPAKSLLYASSLALLNSRRVILLDNKRMIAQLVGLERRTSRGGRYDVIDHAPTAMTTSPTRPAA